MQPFEAECAAIVKHNGIVKILLTTTSGPPSQDEHVLCNLLKSRVDFEQGDVVEIAMKVLRRKKDKNGSVNR